MDRIIGYTPAELWTRQTVKPVEIKVMPGMKPYTMTVFRESDLTPEQWTAAAQMLYENFGIVFVEKESDPISTQKPVPVDFPDDHVPMFEVTVRPIAKRKSELEPAP